MKRKIRLLVLLSAALLLFFLPCEASGQKECDEIFSDPTESAGGDPSIESSPDWDNDFWDDWASGGTIGTEPSGFPELEAEKDRQQAERDAIFEELLREAEPLKTYAIPKLHPIPVRAHNEIALIEILPWPADMPARETEVSTGRIIAAGAFFAFAAGIVIYLVLSAGKEKPDDDAPGDRGNDD